MSCIVLEVPLHNLLTSICDFVSCDRIVQRAHSIYLSIVSGFVNSRCKEHLCAIEVVIKATCIVAFFSHFPLQRKTSIPNTILPTLKSD